MKYSNRKRIPLIGFLLTMFYCGLKNFMLSKKIAYAAIWSCFFIVLKSLAVTTTLEPSSKVIF